MGLARRHFLGAALGMVPALALYPASAQSQAAVLTQLRLERSGEELFLSAALRLNLSPPVQEVLDKGIALYFVAEAEVVRSRWYWFDKRVAESTRYMRLVYQPLTRRWRLNVSPVPIASAGTGVLLNQTYDSLEEALDALGRIARLRLGSVQDMGDEPTQPVAFRFRLDTAQLPRPFQIGLMGQSDWNLSLTHTESLTVEVLP